MKAFTVALRTDKRLKMVDDKGNEEFEQPNTLDTTYLQLLDPNRPPEAAEEDEDASKPSAAEQAAQNPWEAYEKLLTAKGELDVVVDLITNLEQGRYLDLKILANKPRSINALQELATESMGRFGRRRADLEDAAARLKAGAAALRAQAVRDNRFFQQASELQRFWKLRLNPLTAEFVNSPYSVDISLAESSGGALGGPAAPLPPVKDEERDGPGGAARAAARFGMAPTIPLIKDSSGNVCVYIEASRSAAGGTAAAPTVAVGTLAVHRHLLALQQQLLWRTVSQSLEAEARSTPSNFTFSLVHQVLSAVTAPSEPSLFLASLRPLVLEHISTCQLFSGHSGEAPRPYTVAPSSVTLLPELSNWISHVFFRSKVHESLDAQAQRVRSVQLQVVPTTRPCASAVRVLLGRSHSVLLLLQDTSLEVEGIPAAEGSLSRWAREGSASVTKVEVPDVLHSLVQQALGATGCLSAAAP